jgi:mortality factor 4-like protein 1
LVAYFDRALGSILLYPFERQQYLEAISNNPNAAMSELYGGEHLLRLFGTSCSLEFPNFRAKTIPHFKRFDSCFVVQLPELIVHTKMDQETILALRDQLVDFIR